MKSSCQLAYILRIREVHLLYGRLALALALLFSYLDEDISLRHHYDGRVHVVMRPVGPAHRAQAQVPVQPAHCVVV